jgi:hypothetical protein
MTTRKIAQRLVVALALAISIASARIESAANNFLWKATKGAGSLYLVGSVHLLTKDYYPLSPALDAAFKDSDLLVEEVDLGEMIATENQLQMVMTGMLPAGQSSRSSASSRGSSRSRCWRWNGRKQDSSRTSASTSTSTIRRAATRRPCRASKPSPSRSHSSTE